MKTSFLFRVPKPLQFLQPVYHRPSRIVYSGIIVTIMAVIIAGSLNTSAQVASSSIIVFSSDRDGDNEIYFMDPDGSNIQQITFNTTSETQLDCSPDGRKIVFVSDRDGNDEIYVMTINGGSVMRLTNHSGQDLGPCWSPDGTKIAFTSERDGDRELYSINADGSGLQQLTVNTATDGFQDWSPDGSKIAFHSTQSGDVDIWTINADGSDPQNLTTDIYADYMPAWSPDGSKIVYESMRGGYLELFTMDSDGGNKQRLTYIYSDSHEPEWSPDGSRIVFASFIAGNYEVMTINSDGTGLENLSDHGGADGSPSWRASVLPYFGYDLPGLVPERFGPDSLLATDSLFWHGSPVYSPDFQEMHWGGYHKYPDRHAVELFFIKGKFGQWTSFGHPSFADTTVGENNPFFSQGGDTLYFLSRRPGGFIFMTTRTPVGWSQPVPLNIPLPPNAYPGWQFSVAKNGNVYFEIWGDNGNEPPDLYVSRYENGIYQDPVNMGSIINSAYNEIMPFIDADERYLLYSSNRPGGYGWHDAYVSFKRHDSTWTEPVNMGTSINSASEDGYPSISPDGLVLFFKSYRSGDLGYNPYWVSSEVIDSIEDSVSTQLQNFAARYREKGIELTWQVTDGGEDLEFMVLRSKNGSRDYLELDHLSITRRDQTFNCVDRNIESGCTYRYRVDVKDEQGRRYLFETEAITIPRADPILHQNYPNPFNPSTVISFFLPNKHQVNLSIYSLSGELIQTLVDGRLDHGFKEYIWRGTDSAGNPVSSGIYFYRLQAGKRTLARKMILLK